MGALFNLKKRLLDRELKIARKQRDRRKAIMEDEKKLNEIRQNIKMARQSNRPMQKKQLIIKKESIEKAKKKSTVALKKLGKKSGSILNQLGKVSRDILKDVKP